MSLNIWGGRVLKPLLNFIKTHHSVDVFCLQEVYHNAKKQISTETEGLYSLEIFSELGGQLPNHQGYFRPVVGGIYGIGIFVHKDLEVLEEGAKTIHENPTYPGYGPDHARNLQWVKVKAKDNQTYAIVNVHGLWNGQGKTDSPSRINQSEKIRQFLDSLNVPVILCGDFNLRPDTESLKLLEQNLENLVCKYQVTSTRTSLYPKAEKFADYVLTSKEINIKSFTVLDDEVSDHSPLVVELDLQP